MIVLDVDRFKGINDAIGPSVGDSILLTLSRRLGRLLRPGEAIPKPALCFVAEQVRVGVDALATYATRRQTRQEQLDNLREAFGFRMYAPGHGRDGSVAKFREAGAAATCPAN